MSKLVLRQWVGLMLVAVGVALLLGMFFQPDVTRLWCFAVFGVVVAGLGGLFTISEEAFKN